MIDHMVNIHNSSNQEADKSMKCPSIRDLQKLYLKDESYRCSHCEYGSLNMDKLNEHMTGSHGICIYQCTDCPYKATKYKNLRSHIQKCKPKTKPPFQCLLCLYSCPSRNHLLDHADRVHHYVKEYGCSFCAFETSYLVHLRQHTKEHLKSDEALCFKCNATIESGLDIQSHMTSEHDVKKVSKCSQCPHTFASPHTLSSHETEVHDACKRFRCIACSYTTGLWKLFTCHASEKHNTSSLQSLVDLKFCTTNCTVELVSKFLEFESNNEMKNSIEGKNIKFVCTVKNSGECSGPNSETELEDDANTHSKNANSSVEQLDDTKIVKKTIQCQLCPYESDSIPGLLHHNYYYHLEVIAVKTCYYCKKQFTDVEQLKFHMNANHEKESLYICGFCGIPIPNTHLYDAHIFHKHCNTKRFPCFHCPHVTETFRKFRNHLNEVHVNKSLTTTDIHYYCACCDYISFSAVSFFSHYRSSHPEFTKIKCKFCSFEGLPSRFRNHLINVHYKIKTLNCDLCGKKMATRDSLKKHFLVMHGMEL